MKIVVLGGSGVFGERIARMLVRDGHSVVVAGRRIAPLRALADETGASVLVLDRAGDLNSLWAEEPEMVIDAAGPFHAYGEDPYRLAREAIAAGVNYLDLADDADFCLGISVLSEDAKAAGVFALSGVSSVPALSSCVVEALAKADKIDTIETAILPGNRAPRGQSVVDSILFQAGTKFEETIAGEKTGICSWSDPRWFELGPDLSRLGFAIRVPDQVLFPEYFKAKTVRFHAGLDLWISNWGLAGFSWVRSILGFSVPPWMSRAMRWAAERMVSLGSNEGGMVVDVTVETPTGWEKRSWRLVAKNGDGPYIPGIPARVIARNPGEVEPGARPALAEFKLEEAEAAMSDLAVGTLRKGQKIEDIFENVLESDFKKLPKTIQDGHKVPAPRRLKGRASVERGTGLIERIAALVVGFPTATDDIEVEVLMIPYGNLFRYPYAALGFAEVSFLRV